ncbi:MAG: AMP-binding protein [Aliifodinibius sp.]|nr:long-chain fatty acid--CoA ligase [Fodinibius sp.]NIV14826.1 AMP-binding protein [Fodinibius sp.]NIY28705.1 AMP-binding protein [Fodinibius sp.]
MFLDFMISAFKENKGKDAIIWQGEIYSYEWLLDRMNYWQEVINSEEITAGTVTILETDFSPNSVALFLALVEHGCIFVPLTSSVEANKHEFIKIAQGEVSFSVDNNDHVKITRLPNSANHEFYKKLRQLSHPGLVLFSSGSTGKSKASVHDLLGILEKFKVPRHSLRTITFLLYDHIGGVNTLLYTLSNAGCIVTVQDRSPDSVLAAIEKYKVELLPTSPTFINLILLSEAYKRHNIDSLKTVTYGTEPMPESTLLRFHQLFPNIRLQQTYGLSEVGILRSKSKSSDSLWVKVGGEGFETRVVDGILQIRAESAMMGYLNAPSPFTEDGWFITGDAVEENGEFIKILGRKSEIINVGGEKVYPGEVESVIQEIEAVREVTVYGEKNPITGNIVCAKVSLKGNEDPKKFALYAKKYCGERLQSYKVPIKITIVDEKQHSERFKKVRVI